MTQPNPQKYVQQTAHQLANDGDTVGANLLRQASASIHYVFPNWEPVDRRRTDRYCRVVLHLSPELRRSYDDDLHGRVVAVLSETLNADGLTLLSAACVH